MTWERVRVEHIATLVTDTIDPARLGDEVLDHYSIPALDTTGLPAVESADAIESSKQPLHGGELVCSGEFVVLRPDRCSESFLAYLLLSESTRQELDASVNSVTRSHQRVRPEVLTKMWVCVPPLDEQRQVADYLDAETARIDALIAEKRRMIELLGERWRSEVEAGLGGSRTRLKRLLIRRPSYGVLVPSFVEQGAGVPFVRVNALDGLAGMSRSDLPEIEASQASEYRRTSLRGGELLISVVGTMGKAAVVPRSLGGANIARAVCRLEPRSFAEAQLLRLWVTRTSDFLDQARISLGGDTAQPTLNVGDLVEFEVPFPPSIEASEQLWQALSQREHVVGLLRTKLEHQIDLLTEYRQALITAAVTGELPVPAGPSTT